MQTAHELTVFDTEELLVFASRDISAGNYEGGLLKLKLAIQRDDSAAPHAMIARLYAELGLLDKARHHYRIFLTANPDFQLEAFQLGMVELDSGNDNAAMEQWTRVLEMNPTFPPALYYRALLRHKHERLEDARRDIEVIVNAVPEDNLYYLKAQELLADMTGNSSQLQGIAGEYFTER